MSKLHVLLMAAGASQRMGRPKQLLPWGDQKVVQHQMGTLQQLPLPFSVVLGAHEKEISTKVSLSTTQMIYNPYWEEGLSTSIAIGVKTVVQQHPKVEGILIVLADQPLVELAHYKKIVNAFTPNTQQIIVSQSKEGFTSPPVLFDHFYFEELMELQGDHGAKPILKKYAERVVPIMAASNLQDMDTPEAYQALLKLFNRQS